MAQIAESDVIGGVESLVCAQVPVRERPEGSIDQSEPL
jgi:hypothetical protein